VHYEWPFRFRFQDERPDADLLPTAGRYGESTIEYKIVAIPGHLAAFDEHIRWMLNPNDPYYQQEPIYKPTRMLLKANKLMRGAAEEKIQFFQIRPEKELCTVGHLASYNLQTGTDHHKLMSVFRTDGFFTIDVQMSENIIIGLPLTLLLSISSTSPQRAQSPPPVTLTSSQFDSWFVDAVKMDKATVDRPVASSVDNNIIWEGKRQLDIPLSSEPVDVGQLLSFRLAKKDHLIAVAFKNLVPSFKTRRMERTYDLQMQLAVELDGKTYYACSDTIMDVKVVSPDYAPGTTESQPAEPTLLQREA
jgi:hypothetical protein